MPARPHLLPCNLQLHAQITQPLVSPPVEHPLLRCDRFEWLWASSMRGDAALTPGSAAEQGRRSASGRGGLDPVASLRGLTLWRPHPPPGYVSLGDVAVAGSKAPRYAPSRRTFGMAMLCKLTTPREWLPRHHLADLLWLCSPWVAAWWRGPRHMCACGLLWRAWRCGSQWRPLDLWPWAAAPPQVRLHMGASVLQLSSQLDGHASRQAATA